MPLLDDALTRLDRADDVGAAAVLERLAAETPTHATVHVLRAQACERLHRWDEALAAWQTARLFLPDLGIVHEGTLRASRVLAAIQTLRTPPRHAEPVPSTVAPLPDEQAPVADAPAAGRPASLRASEPAPVFFDPVSTTPEASLWDVDPAVVESPAWPAPEMGAWPTAAPVSGAPSSEGAGPVAADPVAVWSEGRADAPIPDVVAKPGGIEVPAAEPEPGTGADARLPGIPSTFDLDDLIESLSTAGRIVPREDVDAVPPPPGLDADAADEVVSPTLARIFAAQGQTAEAIRAFERLARVHPERAAEFRAEADALRAR